MPVTSITPDDVRPPTSITPMVAAPAPEAGDRAVAGEVVDHPAVEGAWRLGEGLACPEQPHDGRHGRAVADPDGEDARGASPQRGHRCRVHPAGEVDEAEREQQRPQ